MEMVDDNWFWMDPRFARFWSRDFKAASAMEMAVWARVTGSAVSKGLKGGDGCEEGTGSR